MALHDRTGRLENPKHLYRRWQCLHDRTGRLETDSVAAQ